MNRVTDPREFGRVAVVMGGDSAERDVSLDGGRAVLAALRAKGVKAEPVDGPKAVMEAVLAGQFDRVFNMLHGRGGEDGQLQGALEVLGVPYTGSGVMASALTMDKVRTKRVWHSIGLPTPDFRLIIDENPEEALGRVKSLGLPLIVKPVREGSTLGLSKVKDLDELPEAVALARRYDSYIVAERFVDGPEYTASVLQGEPLPLVRIDSQTELYDYEAKYHSEATKYLVPCGLESDDEHRLQSLALAAYESVGCSGWGRVDFMLDGDGEAWLLEVNTVPGMTNHSLVPMAAKAVGLDFETLCWRILETSLEPKP
jgi:D-alanine-D-alanine ligase